MKLELTIPESLSDIKLGDYQRFYSEIEEYKQKNIIVRKVNELFNDSEEVFISKKMVSIFCGIDENLVGKIPLKEFEETVLTINKILESNNKLRPKFKLNGVTYGFVTKLDSITLAEFVDVDKYVGSTEQLHRAMGVLFRPITHEVTGGMYLIEDYKGSNHLCDIMLDCRMDIVAGMLVFFWTLGKELVTHTLSCSEEGQEEDSQITQLKQTLELSGGGINQFMH